MFQYALSIVQALSALPRAEFDVMALPAHPLWRPYLDRYSLCQEFIPDRIGPLISKTLLALKVPAPTCRRLTPKIIPAVRAMLRWQANLWIFPAQDVLAYQAPVSALVSIHDLMHRYEPGFPEVSGMGRYELRERRFKGIAQTASAILVDSEIGRQHVVESYDVDAHCVHPLPYVPPAYVHEAPLPGFEDRYQLPAKFAFYPAQFWAHKNHRRLISAVAALRPAHPDLYLVLSGSKTHAYSGLAAYCRELGVERHVMFVGRVSDADMPEFYRRARCLVMPTLFGPTNIPPLEAFALGCPVAVSGIYGMPEQVGDAALTFDPCSILEISDSLRRLWVDDLLCTELSKRGFQRAAAWSQAAFNRRFREVLDAVLLRETSVLK